MSENALTMKAKDSINASLAKCLITINGRQYNAFNFTKFEATFKKNKQKIAILGKTGKGNKSGGWEGTFSGEMHYNVSIYRKMLKEFKDTGLDTYFEIQIENEDPTSDARRQVIVLKDCNLDEGILAKFDATSDDSLSESVSGTFEDFEMPKEFNLLDSMQIN